MTPIEDTDAKQARHDSQLGELAAMAMDLAREAHLVALQQIALPLPPDEIDRVKTFVMLSREVRGIIALEQRLAARRNRAARPRPAKPPAVANPRPEPAPMSAPDLPYPVASAPARPEEGRAPSRSTPPRRPRRAPAARHEAPNPIRREITPDDVPQIEIPIPIPTTSLGRPPPHPTPG